MVVGVLNRVFQGASERHTSSPFDRRAVWVYAITAAELALAAVLIPVLGFRLTPEAAVALPVWAFFLCAAAMLLRRYGHPVFSVGMEATALVYGQGFATLFLLFPLTALSAPLADAHLAAADRLLGFDWPAYAHLFARRPLVQYLLVVAYHSFDWQPLLVVIWLCASRRTDRCWQFVTAGAISSALTTVIYPFAPAIGTFWHFGVERSDFPLILSPWQFGPILEAIKAGERTISPTSFTGIVSFPSYHAAAAAAFTWAMWPTRARWPLVLLNLVLCAAAMIVGGHYLVDILAGLLIGVGSIALAQVTVNRTGRTIVTETVIVA